MSPTLLHTAAVHYCVTTGAMVKRLRETRPPYHIPSVLEEQTVKFSVADSFYQACAAILGAANLGGVLYLRYLCNDVLLFYNA
jgi:hypothetical protein